MSQKNPGLKLFSSRNITLAPPSLPSYLADVHPLTPIVGKPTEEQVKGIHTVIRAQNSVSHLPSLHNPDLSMQLSQHLFDAQMAVYRSIYSKSSQLGANVYIPPTLPPDVPGTLNRVVGAPSDEEIKSVQSAMRHVDSRSNNAQPHDPDLSMKLSQHMFNLQYERHKEHLACGKYGSGCEGDGDVPGNPEPEMSSGVHPGLTQLGGVLNDIKEISMGSQKVLESMNQALNTDTRAHFLGGGFKPQPTTEVLPTLARMEQVMKEMKETMGGTKLVLENVNRVLISTQKTQSVVGSFDRNIKSTVHMNPVNQQGILASDYGLPLLRYWLNDMDYILWMDPPSIAKYLKFFNIGAHLIRGDSEPALLDGKGDEAAKLIFKYIGIQYSNSQYHHAQTS